MQLTQIERVSDDFLKINSEKLKSGNGNFKNNSGRIFWVGNVFVAHGTGEKLTQRVNVESFLGRFQVDLAIDSKSLGSRSPQNRVTDFWLDCFFGFW